MKRVITVLLAVCLLVSLFAFMASAQATAPVKTALVAGEKSEAGVEIMTEPKFYVSPVYRFEGKYAMFRGTDGKYGIMDCKGNVYWKFDEQRAALMSIYPNGLVFSRLDAAVYDVTGKRLTSEAYAIHFWDAVPYSCVDFADETKTYFYGEVYKPGTTKKLGNIVIDAKGRQLMAEDIGPIIDGKITYQKDGKWGMTKLFGEELLPFAYDYLSLVDKDTLLACKNGTYYTMDLKGNKIHTLGTFTEINSYVMWSKFPRMAAKKNNKWGIVNLKTGKTIVSFRYDEIHAEYSHEQLDYYDGKINGIWHYISSDELGVDVRHGDGSPEIGVIPVSNHMLIVRHYGESNKPITVVDGKGNKLLEMAYDCWAVAPDRRTSVVYHYDTEARTSISGDVLDADGKIIRSFQNAKAAFYTKDSLIIQGKDNVRAYTTGGKWLRTVPNVTKLITNESNILFMARDGEYAIANTKGVLMTDFVYKDIHTLDSDDIAMVKKGSSWYLLNNRGKKLLPYAFQSQYDVNYTSGSSSSNVDDYRFYKVGEKYGFFKILPEGAIKAPSVTASNLASSGAVKLTWDAVPNAKSYKVYRSDSKDGDYKLMKTTTALSYVNSTAEPGQKYYYKVKAVNGKVSGPFSTVKSRTCDLPRPVVSITRTAAGKPKLTWKKVAGAVSYKVYRCETKTGTYKLMKTVTNGLSYTNTSAVKGKTYYYKVKAVHKNTDANSAYSTVKSITAK